MIALLYINSSKYLQIFVKGYLDDLLLGHNLWFKYKRLYSYFVDKVLYVYNAKVEKGA